MNCCVSMCVGKRGEVCTGNYLYHLGIKWDLVPQRSGRCWVGSLEFLFLGLRNSHLDLLSYSDFALCFMVQWRGFQWSDYGWPDPKLVRNEICLQASLPELNLAFAERSMSVRELRTDGGKKGEQILQQPVRKRKWQKCILCLLVVRHKECTRSQSVCWVWSFVVLKKNRIHLWSSYRSG